MYPTLVQFERQALISVQADPHGAFKGIGRVYERLGPVQAALSAYEQAIALNPQAIAPYIGLGIIYFDQLFDYAAAVKAFQKGLVYHPEDVFAIGLRGIAVTGNRVDPETGAARLGAH